MTGGQARVVARLRAWISETSSGARARRRGCGGAMVCNRAEPRPFGAVVDGRSAELRGASPYERLGRT